MILPMPCPTKRKGSDNWYFRRTIPADVQRILARLPAKQRPRNWYKTHIAVSLGTADRARAKEKCPEVAAAVERQLKALREGPKPLNAKQIAALAGEAYRTFAETLEADPILTAEQWRDVAEGSRDVHLGKGRLATLGIGDHADLRAADMERQFGRTADAVLARRSIITDEDSRWRLIERLSVDMPKALEKLARNADHDFSRDSYADRFPEWTAPERAEPKEHSLRSLLEAWLEAALARGVKRAKKIHAAAKRFVEWLPHDDARRVTKADVLRWCDERMKAGVTPATINRTDLASLKNVLAWGADRGWLPTYPLDRRTRVEGRGKPKLRDPFFSSREAAAILNAALAVMPKGREHPKTTAAKRWVPWLCAYSGARVTEMIQIRKEDVRQDAGAWVIRLTPEAGTIKTNEFRIVPLHEHIIALGFLEFVKAARNGHLFCEPARDGSTAGPADGVYSRLREFVRGVVPDPNVQPNHAWRYTFKTVGLEAGIDEIALDALCGHAARHKGRDYTKVTVSKRITAMRKFPWYRMTPRRASLPPLNLSATKKTRPQR